MGWFRSVVAALGCLVFAWADVGAAQPRPAADGMRVIFCGTSGPLPVRDRAKPCTAILAGGVLYLVDVGPEAAEVARAAGARRLVLTHLTQAGLPFFTPEAFTRGTTDGGPIDWRLARDGMTIDLPAGSDDIRFGQF